MELVQRLASLGRAARSKAGVKVRQPLPEVLVGVADEAEVALVTPHEQTLLDELNVKALRFVDASSESVGYLIKPNLPVLGPRLGKEVEPASQRAAVARTGNGGPDRGGRAGRRNDRGRRRLAHGRRSADRN